MSPNNRHLLAWLVPLIALVAFIGLELSGAYSVASLVREWVRGDLGRFVPRPDYAGRAELIFTGVVGLVIVYFFTQRKLVQAGVVAVGAICAAIIISWRAEVDGRIFLDAAYPAMVIAIIFMLGRFIHLLDISTQRKTVWRAFAPRLPNAKAASIARTPELLGLSGQTRNITYLVCSLHGVSNLADTDIWNAATIAAFSQKVMTALRQAVLDNGGMIDHVAPGELTAFFNAPFEDSAHAANACEAALAMVEKLKPLNTALEKELHVGEAPIAQVELGIGIESGACVVGNFGTVEWPEYSVAGRAAKFAGDIESLCAKYGPTIIVGKDARAAAESRFAFLELDSLDAGPKGVAQPIYGLLGASLVRSSPKFRALQTFHEHIFRTYRTRQWDKTRALIQQCRALSSPNPVHYDLYLARIAYFESNPPKDDWNGVFVPPQL